MADIRKARVTAADEAPGQASPALSANPPSQPASIAWNDSAMQTHFANVVNVQSTREQVDLFFGTNKSWNLVGDTQVSVDLSNRVILTPFAAKRLLSVLGNVMSEYEARYGSLATDK